MLIYYTTTYFFFKEIITAQNDHIIIGLTNLTNYDIYHEQNFLKKH
jgi:hypothetical protein